jgi:DNA-directed RNA polymerase specialized sigma24 family protein
MSSHESVTHWIGQFQRGDACAVQKLWDRYFQRLVRLAREKLPRRLARVADEEDVALSAFQSLCRGVKSGRYPQLSDRNDLWRLLVVITAHKAIHLVRDQQRQKRGGPRPADADRADEPTDLSQLIGKEPTPDFAAQVAETLQQLLERLDDAGLRPLAVWKMEGYTNEEIAVKLDCAVRTVERKLRLIRSTWGEGHAT